MSPRIAILTSVSTRHRYFVNRLRGACDVRAVVYEEVRYTPAAVDATDLTDEERAIVTEHFAERDRQEERFFGDQSDPASEGPGCAVRHVDTVQLNTAGTVDLLESAGVDTVVVFGTNLIKPPLLDRWPGRMINMHLGLSPYYRGTATNFYPLLNEEPQYVGATIHRLDASIDGGAILKHARPEIVIDDRPHTIGCKAIIAGIEAMIDVLQRLDTGRIKAVSQWEVQSSRLYLRKDYHPRQVVELYRKLDTGLIPKYLDRTKRKPDRIRLIE